MIYQNKTAAAWGSKTAFNKKINVLYDSKITRRKPNYFHNYLRYPNLSFVAIASDWNASNIAHRLGMDYCLLCEDDPSIYDLRFCEGKEVWVLAASFERKNRAIELGYAARLSGAKKVLVLTLCLNSLEEVINVRE